jgi:Trm5-related predicted tRNA methylase
MSISTFARNASIAEMAVEMDRRGAVIEALEAKLKAVANVQRQYADQARFADHEPAAYFREFVRRLDDAMKAEPHNG